MCMNDVTIFDLMFVCAPCGVSIIECWCLCDGVL